MDNVYLTAKNATFLQANKQYTNKQTNKTEATCL